MPTRVPESVAPFNDYLTSTDTFLQAISSGTTKNWERLQLSQQNADDWHAMRQAWDPLYVKKQDPAQLTKIVNAQVQTFIKDFKTFSTNILDKIAASDNATDTDAIIFRVVLSGNKKAPTHPTSPITEQCVLSIASLGGASYKFSFRTGTDTGNPSLADGADSIIIALQVGGTVPENADAIEEKVISTKASFVQNTGTQNIGQRLYIAQRWYHTKYPDLAGPWSNIQSIMIA